MDRPPQEVDIPKRRRRARAALVGGVLALALLSPAIGYYGFYNRGINEHLDASYIAAAETRMWKAYYTESPGRMIVELFRLLRHQFGLSVVSATLVGKDLAIAATTFSKITEDYERRIVPPLERAYARIRDAVDEQWDPHAVARAELAWWVARRTPGQNSPEAVGRAIAHQYAVMHGETNADIERAGLLRARAGHLRDQGERNADWEQIEALLAESYCALIRGTGRD